MKIYNVNTKRKRCNQSSKILAGGAFQYERIKTQKRI